MKAVIEIPLEVHCVSAFAETAWLEPRPELQALCKAAKKNKEALSEGVVQNILPGISAAGAKQILRYAESLGIIKSSGSLTNLGLELETSGEAPIPEQGIYSLWLSKHELIGSRAIHIERFNTGPELRVDALQHMPFLPDFNTTFESAIDHQKFLLRSFPHNNKDAPKGVIRTMNSKCQLVWTLDWDNDFNTLFIQGSLAVAEQNANKNIKLELPRITIDLRNLAKQWGTGPLAEFGKWSDKDQILAVQFKDVSEESAESFLYLELELKDASIEKYLTSATIVLSDVPIGPKTKTDAQNWSIKRLSKKVAQSQRKIRRDEIREMFIEVVQDTPLANFQPELPSHTDLLKQYNSSPERFWALSTPVDLAPWTVPPYQLAPLKFDSTTPENDLHNPSAIIVPYRSGWSMRKLVTALTMEREVKRVLLVDRHVSGDNLPSLGLFLDALRNTNDSTILDVWTLQKSKTEAEANLDKRVRNFKSYTETFGANHKPHDRYMVLVPKSGDVFAWQMSHSPLHARFDKNSATIDSPLTWNDFSAIRLQPEQLLSAMQQWAKDSK